MRYFPQAPNAVVMVRPHHFCSNPQTALDNSFQSSSSLSEIDIAQQAFNEVTQVAETLQNNGVRVHLFEDETKLTPDSVFPNNWFTTHAGGYVGVFPMYPENRRLERRLDVIEMLKTEYRVQEVCDYSGLEQDGIYLEGTGAMVLDHLERIAYAVESNRMSPVALERFCAHFNYEPMLFNAEDKSGLPIYHTNVLMTLGTEFVLIGDELFTQPKRKLEILSRLEQSGREIISLTEQQIAQFAGNALELAGDKGKLLALSQTAFNSLSTHQIKQLEQYVTLLPMAIPTIELAGGSVRCMLAGVHLSKR